MRDTYREQLESVITDLVEMSRLVTVAVRNSTKALLEADLQRAESVISEDEKIDAAHNEIEQTCFSLLARQSPVAGELRTVVAALRMIGEMARMGDLAAHVAKIARMRYPEHAVPQALEPNFARMAEVAEAMVTRAGDTLQSRNVEHAEQLASNDEEMDDLRRSQFRVLLGEDWGHGVEAAVDVALLGRYYERIADHAVSIARRIVYIVTGETSDDDAWTNL